MPREFVDMLGRPVHLPQAPQRVVSLVASQTETLVLLGLGERLVGRTRYCVEPRGQVESIPVIGGEKSPDVKAILALEPDLVVANKEENKRSDVERLEAAGVPVYVAYPRTVPEGVEMIRRFGELLGLEEQAEVLAGPCEAALIEPVSQPPLRTLCFIWRDPWMVAGGDNFLDDMIRRSGGENLGAGLVGRYPAVALEQAMALSPEVILLPDEPFLFGEAHVGELAGFSAVPAVRCSNVVLLDGRMLSWYGPRIAHSLRALRGILRDCATRLSPSHPLYPAGD